MNIQEVLPILDMTETIASYLDRDSVLNLGMGSKKIRAGIQRYCKTWCRRVCQLTDMPPGVSPIRVYDSFRDHIGPEIFATCFVGAEVRAISPLSPGHLQNACSRQIGRSLWVYIPQAIHLTLPADSPWRLDESGRLTEDQAHAVNEERVLEVAVTINNLNTLVQHFLSVRGHSCRIANLRSRVQDQVGDSRVSQPHWIFRRISDFGRGLRYRKQVNLAHQLGYTVIPMIDEFTIRLFRQVRDDIHDGIYGDHNVDDQYPRSCTNTMTSTRVINAIGYEMPAHFFWYRNNSMPMPEIKFNCGSHVFKAYVRIPFLQSSLGEDQLVLQLPRQSQSEDTGQPERCLAVGISDPNMLSQLVNSSSTLFWLSQRILRFSSLALFSILMKRI